MSKPSLKERLASSFSGQARTATPVKEKKTGAASSSHSTSEKSVEHNEIKGKPRRVSGNEKAAHMDTIGGSRKEVKMSTEESTGGSNGDELTKTPSIYNLVDILAAPLLVDLLESDQAPGGCSLADLRAWLNLRQSDSDVILTVLRNEGLVVEHDGEKIVRVPQGDALSMAETPQVRKLFRELVLSNSEVLSEMIRIAHREDRTLVLDSLLGMSLDSELVGAVKSLCSRRIRDTALPSEIFRADGPDSALLAAYNRSHTSLVRSLVLKSVETLMQCSQAFEVDRTMQFQILQAGNLLNLRNLTNFFFESLDQNLLSYTSSQESVSELRLLPMLCAVIRDEARVKFPEQGDTAVLNFLVLRKLSPAIVFPEAYLQLPKPNASQRRVLLLFAKIVQSVCNGEQMADPLAPLNDLVEQHHDRFIKFLLNIAEPVSPVSDSTAPSISVTLSSDPPPMSKHRLAECLIELGLQQPQPDLTNDALRKALSCANPSLALDRFLFRCRFAAQLSDKEESRPDSHRSKDSSDDNDFLGELRKAQELVGGLDGNNSSIKELSETIRRLAILGSSFQQQCDSRKSRVSEDSDRSPRTRVKTAHHHVHSSGRASVGSFLAPK